MDGMQAGIGHNSGSITAAALDPDILRDQLALDHAELFAKRDELRAEAKRYVDKFPNGPSTDEEAGAAADMVKEIKAWAKKAEAAHPAAKKPYLDCGRVVDVVLKQETADKLIADARLIEGLIGKHAIRKADAERKRLDDERRAREAEANRLAAQAAAEQNALRANDIMDQAIEAAEAAEAATKAAAASPAELGRTRGAYGSTTSLRDNWVYRVDNLLDLVKAVAAGTAPISYLCLNESAVGAAVRAKDGVRSIPGLTIENQPKTVVL